jgi:hypothetical protein
LPRRQASSSLAWASPRVGHGAEERQMSADGTWKLAMQTPIGERKVTLDLKSAGAALSGKLTADGNSTDIFDGAANGDNLTFKAAIKVPMPLTLEFTAAVSGDKISGSVNASGVGSWPFSGARG